MAFHWSLNDSKFPQVSGPLFSILADLKNVVWMVSTRSQISKSSNPLVAVSSAPITIGVTVNFMFHSFFSSLARSWYLSLFSLFFSFTMWLARTTKSNIRQVLLINIVVMMYLCKCHHHHQGEMGTQIPLTLSFSTSDIRHGATIQ